MYNDAMIYGNVPRGIRKRCQRYMEHSAMSLADAFREAVRDTRVPRDSELFKAFESDDYRRFIPSAYQPGYLDFNKHPLNYKPEV